ncbi:RNA recognition motif domain-containing protein [Flavobacterium suzhouense]|uniref:RNA recognition motif domain-containing protein n=1 Tax=Flavobacterium suzhouense TaxID=1529638 RepID=A0ABW5NX86_9FLAO
MNIYVANLGYGTSENQVRDAFAAHGAVTSVKLIIHQVSGRAKGFGFVEMPNTSEAEIAIEELNNSRLDSQVIVVNEARPKTQNNSFGADRSGSGYSRSNDRRY